jgi:hypothetical protein
MQTYVTDAQQRALSFLINQAARIEPAVYAMRYQDIQYPGLIPIDTGGNEWLQQIVYFSQDMVGRARWFNGAADDVPNADVTRDRQVTNVHMASIGYSYNLEELGQAQAMGIDLRADKAAAARRASEEFIDNIFLLGDTTKGVTGIANSAGVTAGTGAAVGGLNGATNSPLWINKTPTQILADVNTMLTGMFTTSVGTEIADTLLLPYAQFLDISGRPVSDLNQQPILDYIRQYNIYTAQTGTQLTIRAMWQLNTAGAGSTARAIAYRRDPSVAVLYMPMPFRFFPPVVQGPIKFEVPGIFRISGVDVRRPAAVRYVDGI